MSITMGVFLAIVVIFLVGFFLEYVWAFAKFLFFLGLAVSPIFLAIAWIK